ILQGDLDWIVMKALEKERARRYESPKDLSEDLQRYIEGAKVEARPPSLGYQLRKFVRKHKVEVAAAAAVFLALVVGMVGTTLQAREAQRARAEAVESRDAALDVARALVNEVEEAVRQLPGATKAREIILEQSSLALERLTALDSDDSAIVVARAELHQVRGELQGGLRGGGLGSIEDAIASLGEAVAIRRTLLEQDGAAARLALAGALIALADGQRRSSAEAERSLATNEEAEALLNGWQAPEAFEARRRYLLSQALVNRGRTLFTRAPDEARDPLERGLEVRRSLAADYPNEIRYTREETSARHWLALLAEQQGDLDEAVRLHDQNLLIRRRLAESQPDNATFARDIVTTLLARGQALATMGEQERADADYLEAARRVESLSGEDPSDKRLARDAAIAVDKIGNTHFAAGRYEEALLTYRDALKAHHRNVELDPDRLGNHYQVVQTENKSANTLVRLGRMEEAIECRRRARDRCREIREI
ncbi:MAG: tetratricopeptide repeat protein, partial [Planctomycetota bacterium]|nr:tetratricopeptide repeat protein [Planctomycetota bacterium]